MKANDEKPQPFQEVNKLKSKNNNINKNNKYILSNSSNNEESYCNENESNASKSDSNMNEMDGNSYRKLDLNDNYTIQQLSEIATICESIGLPKFDVGSLNDEKLVTLGMCISELTCPTHKISSSNDENNNNSNLSTRSKNVLKIAGNDCSNVSNYSYNNNNNTNDNNRSNAFQKYSFSNISNFGKNSNNNNPKRRAPKRSYEAAMEALNENMDEMDEFEFKHETSVNSNDNNNNSNSLNKESSSKELEKENVMNANGIHLEASDYDKKLMQRNIQKNEKILKKLKKDTNEQPRKKKRRLSKNNESKSKKHTKSKNKDKSKSKSKNKNMKKGINNNNNNQLQSNKNSNDAMEETDDDLNGPQSCGNILKWSKHEHSLKLFDATIDLTCDECNAKINAKEQLYSCAARSQNCDFDICVNCALQATD